jgi:uncharacterized protein YutE (UPF0331/DUF86 family)
MLIDKELIRKKIQELQSYLKELENTKNMSWDEFHSSLGKQWMICHGLQLSIQAIIDVGNHILAAVGENQIEEYVDIIDKLGERNIIPSEFAHTIRGMAGLRNILVHEYARLDIRIIYDIVQNQLKDFYDFIEYINHYLKNSS